mgnify:CR=1 FL=1|jgi:hypothetical protein
MRITSRQLRQIIREEVERMMDEAGPKMHPRGGEDEYTHPDDPSDPDDPYYKEKRNKSSYVGSDGTTDDEAFDFYSDKPLGRPARRFGR